MQIDVFKTVTEYPWYISGITRIPIARCMVMCVFYFN